MNKFYMTGMGMLLSSALLTGCVSGAGPEFAYSDDRVDAIYALVQEDGRADTFAQDLCVITGTEDQSDTGVDAEAAAVFGINGQEVFFQKNAFEKLYPASITKVMTALIALKYGNLEDRVTVGEETVITEAGATLCHVKPGETMTMEQLLYGLMLPSGNDAGAAIAVHMAGSIEAFSDLMNREARAVGATDTHFVNPHGLHDENHYTTAYDLYLIFNEALKYPEFRTIIHTTSYTADYTDASGNAKSQTWKNSNRYLTGERETPDGLTALGGKTGTTKAAGYCLIMASEDTGGNDYISVVLKAGSRPNLYDNMTNIIQKIVN